jgi:uncharacterized protein
MNMATVEQLIQHYAMQRHPEGGWYKETYKSSEVIPSNALPVRFLESRVFSTAIYFLLEAGNFSAFHRIKSDECWHFYSGDALLVYIIRNDGSLDIITLGSNFANGEIFQYVVPANCWFASIPAPKSRFCLAGCTVSPGFDFADFELADANALSIMYPQHTGIIYQLCR